MQACTRKKEKVNNFHAANICFGILWGLTEDIQESTNDAIGKCIDANASSNALFTVAYGLTNNGTS